MEAHEVTPANIHLAVAALLTNQNALTKQLNSQDLVLLEIRGQVIKTNGRVTAAESAIHECKAGVKDALAKGGCPGVCIGLGEKIRVLEDAQLQAKSGIAGARWVVGAAVATGGIVASAVNWFFGKP